MANIVVRQALGRTAAMGDLYNIRTDNFCQKNMFKALPTFAAIKFEKTEWTKIQDVGSDSLINKLSALDAEGDLKLSILSGLCSLADFGPYLSEACGTFPLTSRIIQGLYIQIATTTEQFIFNPIFASALNMANLNLNREATHAIEGITYGTSTLITLEYDGQTSNVRDINSTMKSMLSILEKHLSGKPVTNSQMVASLNQPFKITIYSDTLPSKILTSTSFQQALDFVHSIPSLLDHTNGGRGVPQSYVMTPLPVVRKYLNPNSNGTQRIRAIAPDIITNLIKCFENGKEIEQKILDIHDTIQSNKFCIKDADIGIIVNIRTHSESHWNDFRKELAKQLFMVRAGNAKASTLNGFRIQYDNRPYSAKNVIQMVSRFNDMLDKIKLINGLKAKGVRYSGKDVPLERLIDNQTRDIYVLNYFSYAKKNKIGWKEQKKAFLEMVNNPKNMCVFLDNDFNNFSNGSDNITISKYSNGKLTSLDHFADKSRSENRCFAISYQVKPASASPKRRAYVIAPCPCTGSAPTKGVMKGKKTWYCSTCKDNLIYGFDDNFYCSCGTASCWSYLFKCNGNYHGINYLPLPVDVPKSKYRFHQIFRDLKPFMEVNILLLGETGVGKSTWINSFVNYLTYNTMEEAERQGPRYLIGTSFVMTNDKYEEVKIVMGEVENENNTKGKSTTQMPNSYVFYAGDLMVRLIDTPGIGDTRGIEQDKENFQNILSHLSHHVEINGICILLKSNNSRMTITFQFCIKELLTHLHKDACKNISFVFTNARETFYKPGDTFSTLKNLLLENPDIEIQLGKETIYCMDNESVRFLAATKQGITFNTEDRSNYSSSWKKSVAENERLIQHILELQPHSTRKTISLNEARRLILGLTEPLAQISTNIQNNIFLSQNRMNEISQMSANSQKLKGKLNIPMIDIEAKTIPYPRTVCTSKGCVDAIDVQGTTKVDYRTWCHEHCYLKNVTVQQHPAPELQNCAAMGGIGTCKVCTCSWEHHMHITYECVQVTKYITDNNVDRRLAAESNSIKKVEIFLAEVRERIKKLQEEQAIINRVASKCGNFLKQNAITPYNDSVDGYLQQCIRVQRDLVYAGASGETLKGLEKMLASYREEVRILETAMRDSTGIQIYPEDIPKLISDLYQLPINGKTLQEFVEVAQNARRDMVAYQEQVYESPNKNKNTFLTKVWNASKNVFSKQQK